MRISHRTIIALAVVGLMLVIPLIIIMAMLTEMWATAMFGVLFGEAS